jgi:hypothetical protein
MNSIDNAPPIIESKTIPITRNHKRNQAILNNNLDSPMKQLKPNNFVNEPLTERNNGTPSESEEDINVQKNIIGDSFDSDFMIEDEGIRHTNLRINTKSTKELKIKMIN